MAKHEKWAPLDRGDQLSRGRLWAAVRAPTPSVSPCLNGVVPQGPCLGGWMPACADSRKLCSASRDAMKMKMIGGL